MADMAVPALVGAVHAGYAALRLAAWLEGQRGGWALSPTGSVGIGGLGQMFRLLTQRSFIQMAESRRQDIEQPKDVILPCTGDVGVELVRTPADQRGLLVATIRDVSEWRRQKAEEFGDDAIARKRSLRAKQALRNLANFVEAMPDEDPDLNLYALRRAGERKGGLRLAPDSVLLLSRFGLDRGAWQSTEPTESQMRNVLRRIDGVEARERHARKLRAEMGYGDE